MLSLQANTKNISEKESRLERLKDNYGDLEDLFFAVYKTRAAKDSYRKKYDTNYAPMTKTAWLAFDERDKPVASLGIIPCYLRYGSSDILAAQLVDGMTIPGYRNRGLFTRLSEAILEFCSANSVKLLFGFPNQFAAPAMLKHGWQKAGNLYRFEVFQQEFSLQKLFRRSAAGSALKKYQCSDNGLANSIADRNHAALVRNSAYLAYKASFDKSVIVLGGVKLWIKSGENLSIGDIEIGEGSFDEMISSLRGLSKKLGVKKTFFQSSDGTALFTRFAKRVQPLPSFPVVVKDLGSGIRLEDLKFSFADIDIF